MVYEQIVVRYGDLIVKGRNRNGFEKVMLKHIKTALAQYENITYFKDYGRLYIKLNGEPYEAIAARLKDMFGITSFSPVVKTETELEAIRHTALAMMTAFPHPPKTFKMSVKRAWKKFPHSSQEMNHLVGSHVLRAIPELKVDVHHPEVELRVDIQQEGTYLFYEVIEAAGGFPFGTNGKAMLLLSGGIDSPAAGWLAMRKGLELEAVHFHSYPYTSDKAKEKVVELARQLSYYSAVPLKLHLVPFTDIQLRIVEAKQEALIITLMRRAMLRITEKLAEANDAGGIVTGESLGQVASQTLTSMDVIGRAASLPLIKPLIAMDKHEIIRLAERIGTYETSILPYEDCCTLFVPKSPAIHPNLKFVERIESFMPEMDELIQAAIDRTEQIMLTPDSKHAEQTAGQDDWF